MERIGRKRWLMCWGLGLAAGVGATNGSGPGDLAKGVDPVVVDGVNLLVTGIGRVDWIEPGGGVTPVGNAPLRLGIASPGLGWLRLGTGRDAQLWSVVRLGGHLAVGSVAQARLGGGTAPQVLPKTPPGQLRRLVGDGGGLLPSGPTVAGDFHTHTFLTDGAHVLDDIAAHAFGGSWALRQSSGEPVGDSTAVGFGLDWFANSEHGGAFARDRFGRSFREAKLVPKGVPNGNSMWRWQSLQELSWPAVDSLRSVYPRHHLFQGVEWNVPTHEHASVGILASTPAPIARFEFFFDAQDDDTAGAWPDAGLKDRVNSHAKALRGAQWLAESHADSSWIVINHPSRLRRTSSADLRDLQAAGGPVFLGIEAIPGHQQSATRGGYNYASPYPDDPQNARTFGGVDRMLARVGGVMDALWSEGRRIWIFANSDFHNRRSETDYFPGEYAKNITQVTEKSESGILAGLRSGATVAVMGDLVDSFALVLFDGQKSVAMGQELVTDRDSIEVLVRWHTPAQNAFGDHPQVDHVDLIGGRVGNLSHPGEPGYDADTVATTQLVATVNTADLVRGPDGWYQARWKAPRVGAAYYRVRGSRMARGLAGWTDSLGNPLCDALQAPNNDAKARASLWFYSNPVFVRGE